MNSKRYQTMRAQVEIETKWVKFIISHQVQNCWNDVCTKNYSLQMYSIYEKLLWEMVSKVVYCKNKWLKLFMHCYWKLFFFFFFLFHWKRLNWISIWCFWFIIFLLLYIECFKYFSAKFINNDLNENVSGKNVFQRDFWHITRVAIYFNFVWIKFPMKKILSSLTYLLNIKIAISVILGIIFAVMVNSSYFAKQLI